MLPLAEGPVGVSEFYRQIGQPSPPRPGPQTREVLGKGRGQTGVSLVLEGGGGKGFCYVECLKQLKQAMERSQKGQFAIDEFVGTSAGAITAGLLASGIPLEELSDVMKVLDFKKFFSDFIWIQGGVDPQARGVNQAGCSVSKPCIALDGLLSEQLGVEGRPILFLISPSS